MNEWDCCENKKLNIFRENDQDKKKMNDFIAEKNIVAAIELAHKGTITESFLDLLIKLRDKFDEIKEVEPEDRIKNILYNAENL